ncbi:MAG TPA: hypothetical protein PLE75_04140 [Ferruginibacter sp.]|nr:hypothetical protein [Ferruginibacter sp.]HRO05854.1 hypothetical protein [Ferruginibacter sp.]HRO96636.1 hypothetical protein [Ferruginibacter sp.]HRP48846.1 hypothetical protein [Ferruginibacter sp.]
MKFSLLVFCIWALFSCTGKDKVSAPVVSTPVAEPSVDTAENYFPVTNYIKGQIAEIRERGLNPLMIVLQNGRSDSSWLRVEDFEKQFAPYLTPVIDTANFKSLFKETKFEDQSLDTYTWSYEPYKTLPDTFTLKRWDVYVSPATSKVVRVYWMKETGKNAQEQLMWNSGSSCKMVQLHEQNGNIVVDKEIIIKWDFNE